MATQSEPRNEPPPRPGPQHDRKGSVIVIVEALGRPLTAADGPAAQAALRAVFTRIGHTDPGSPEWSSIWRSE